MKLFNQFFFIAILTVCLASPEPADNTAEVAEFMANGVESEDFFPELAASSRRCTSTDEYILAGRSLSEFAADVFRGTEEKTKKEILKHEFGFFELYLSEPCAGCMAEAILCGVNSCASTMCADRVRNCRHHSLDDPMYYIISYKIYYTLHP